MKSDSEKLGTRNQELGTRNMLTLEQCAVVDGVLEREQAKRHHLVVALSGAHAYGFPSPDSDVDLKGVHVLPTAVLVGLGCPEPAVSRMEVIDGVEVDYSSNEILGVLLGVVKGNGNYIERIVGRTLLLESPHLAGLQELTRGALSRRVYGHYKGFSTSQLHELERSTAKTAKLLLYVFRTLLTGVHMLRTGELVTDLYQLIGEYELPEVARLIEAKRAGEKMVLGREEVEAWTSQIPPLYERMEKARDGSILPETPVNVAELDRWLVELRRAFF